MFSLVFILSSLIWHILHPLTYCVFWGYQAFFFFFFALLLLLHQGLSLFTLFGSYVIAYCFYASYFTLSVEAQYRLWRGFHCSLRGTSHDGACYRSRHVKRHVIAITCQKRQHVPDHVPKSMPSLTICFLHFNPSTS